MQQNHIFFSERNLKKLEKDSFEYNVELQFIKEKEKEIESYKAHINNDLRKDIGDKNFEKVKDQTTNEKVQLLIKLEKHNHIDQEEVIEKHINQVDRNDDYNHLEHEYEQSSYIMKSSYAEQLEIFWFCCKVKIIANH